MYSCTHTHFLFYTLTYIYVYIFACVCMYIKLTILVFCDHPCIHVILDWLTGGTDWSDFSNNVLPVS